MTFSRNNEFRYPTIGPVLFSVIFKLVAIAAVSPSLAVAGELTCLSGAEIIDHVSNDGDSFYIKAEGRQLLVRLYFIDCPEISARNSIDALRIKDQMRYFGLDDPQKIIEYGNAARRFVQDALAEPFTVCTAHASAPGRSTLKRVYAFVVTSDGEDLGQLLVKSGLARAHGLGRATPEGIPRKEMASKLNDLQSAAMLKKTGIWEHSLPDKIADFRELHRQEQRELDQLRDEAVGEGGVSAKVININSATKSELMTIKGIGPVLAQRIIEGRPYKSLEAVLNVKGIGRKKLIEIKKYCIVGK